MNTSEQAKNGFKTFIFTFFISILVFGAFYYLISDSAGDDINVEASNVMGVTTGSAEGVEPKPSPFAQLAAQNPGVQSQNVLAGSDTNDGTTTQTTQSTVPETGVAGMTFVLFTSLILLAIFAYIVFINPRKYALSKFQNNVMHDLD